MFRMTTAAIALTAAFCGAAMAETHEVEMLNRGENGETMVFSPAALRIAAGDTVKFIASSRGHNAESITIAWPEGAETFSGKINEEVEHTFDQEGFYGVKCKPHFAMGMVMTIAVGAETAAPEGWLEGRLPPRTKKRMKAQLEALSQ